MGLVRVSGFMFQVLGVHLLSPPVSGGESGRSTDTDYRVQMTDYRGRHQLVGTRNAVSAKVNMTSWMFRTRHAVSILRGAKPADTCNLKL